MKIISLILVFIMTFTLVACGNNASNTNRSDIPTDEDNSSIVEDDSSCIKIRTLTNTIRQENKENDINIILINDKTTLTVDELFSYTENHMVDIYALSDSSIDYSKKKMSLNVGYNHFQIKFKNLSDYSETFFDIEVFRDPGIITREFSEYQLHREITKSTGQNGFPKFDLKIYVSNWFDSVDVNGEKLPTQIVECNLKIAYYANFYIHTANYQPSYVTPATTKEFFSITHTFTDLKETFETTIDFPQYFWKDYCSKNPYATLENTKQGFEDRSPNEFYIYDESYISLRVDYSQYQFD